MFGHRTPAENLRWVEEKSFLPYDGELNLIFHEGNEELLLKTAIKNHVETEDEFFRTGDIPLGDYIIPCCTNQCFSKLGLVSRRLKMEYNHCSLPV